MAKEIASVEVTDNSEQVLDALSAALERGLEAVGLMAESHAKELCPVDTGRLRNSITHVVQDDEVYIGTNVEYGPDVELGTNKRKARPFLRPAAENYGSEYKTMLESSLKNG